MHPRLRLMRPVSWTGLSVIQCQMKSKVAVCSDVALIKCCANYVSSLSGRDMCLADQSLDNLRNRSPTVVKLLNRLLDTLAVRSLNDFSHAVILLNIHRSVARLARCLKRKARAQGVHPRLLGVITICRASNASPSQTRGSRLECTARKRQGAYNPRPIIPPDTRNLSHMQQLIRFFPEHQMHSARNFFDHFPQRPFPCQVDLPPRQPVAADHGVLAQAHRQSRYRFAAGAVCAPPARDAVE